MSRTYLRLASLGKIISVLICFSVFGCTNLKDDPPPEAQTHALFAPCDEQIPLPSDIALDDDGTLPVSSPDLKRRLGRPITCPENRQDNESSDREGENNDQTESDDSKNNVGEGAAGDGQTGSDDGGADNNETENTGKKAAEDVEPKNAQEVFELYQDDIHGWLTEQSIEFPFNGPLDVESIEPNQVHLLKKVDGEYEQIEVEELDYTEQGPDTSVLTIVPASDIELESEYAAAIEGPIEDAVGKPVGTSQAMFLAKSPEPLIDENGEAKVSVLEGMDESTRRQLEQLRKSLQPVFEKLESLGAERKDILAATEWTTSSDTFAVLSVGDQKLPFPNDALNTGEKGIDIPKDNFEEGTAGYRLITEINRLEGFSPTAPGWVPFKNDLDTESLSRDTVRMANLRESYGRDDYELNHRPQLDHLFVEPTPSLTFGSLQVGVITTDLKGKNGRPVKPTPTYALLRSPHPVVEGTGECEVDSDCNIPESADCQSSVSAVPDDQAAFLEEARCDFQLLFETIPTLPGIGDGLDDRYDMAMTWPFTTGDPTRMLRQIRAQIAAKFPDETSEAKSLVTDQCETDECLIEDPGSSASYPGQEGRTVDMSNVATIQRRAAMKSIDVFDDKHHRKSYEQLSLAEEPNVGMTIFVPEAVDGECSPPFNVAVLLHRLYSSRNRVGYALANDLAAPRNCVASVAIDAVGHGGRLSETDSLHPGQTPKNSGQDFVGKRVVEMKANAGETISDLFVLSQIIQADALESAVPAEQKDLFAVPADPNAEASQTIGVAGVGFGGVFAVPFATVDPAVNAAAVNGTGGRLTELMRSEPEATTGIVGPLKKALDEAEIEPETFRFEQVLVLNQWLIDAVDPLGFAARATGSRENLRPVLAFDPSTGEYEKRKPLGDKALKQASAFMVQMIQGDEVIPNKSTELMAEAMGPNVSLDNTTFSGVTHEFLTRFADEQGHAESTECARRQMATWLGSAVPKFTEVDDPGNVQCGPDNE